ncbi:putative membrane protein [Rossellomorea marisflavi]
MLYIRYMFYQSLLFTVIVIMNYYLDPYLTPPFTIVDATAILVSLLALFVVMLVVVKLYRPFKGLRYRTKFLLSVPAFLLTIAYFVLGAWLFF